MGWAGIALVVAVLAVAIVVIIAITKVGINLDRRPRKPTRVRRLRASTSLPSLRRGAIGDDGPPCRVTSQGLCVRSKAEAHGAGV